MEVTEAQVINFEKICRLCLQENTLLTEIFDSTEEDYMTIDRKIMACTSIEVCKNDGLPTRICVRCLSSVNAAFDFRTLCENSDKALHEIINLLEVNKTNNENLEQNINNVNLKGRNEFQNEKQSVVQDISHVIFVKNQEIKTPITQYDTDAVYIVNENDCVKEKFTKENFENAITFYNEECFTSSASCNSKDCEEKEEETNLFVPNQLCFADKSEPGYLKNVVASNLESQHQRPANKVKMIEGQSVEENTKKMHCPYCNKKLTRIDEHIRLLHRNRIYKCNKHGCGAEFLTLKNLQSHQLNCYNLKKDYKCSRCLKEFHRKSNFKAHIRRHSNTKDFQCQLCDRAFVDPTGLRRHFLKHHEPEQQVFISGCCGKRFKSKEGLKKHIRKSICGIQIFQVIDSDWKLT